MVIFILSWGLCIFRNYSLVPSFGKVFINILLFFGTSFHKYLNNSFELVLKGIAINGEIVILYNLKLRDSFI